MNGILLSEITDLYQPFTFDELKYALNNMADFLYPYLPFACGLFTGMIISTVIFYIISDSFER